MANHKHRPILIAVAIVAVLAAVGVGFAFLWPRQPADPGADITPLPDTAAPADTVTGWSITADKDTAAGIERDSGFIIRAAERLDAPTVSRQLSIVPAVSYDLQQRSPNELYILTKVGLEPDTVYNIQIADNDYEPPRSWAFQTKNDFRLTGTFPADGGRYVPANSGIELYFSQPVGDIGRYVTVSPPLAGKVTLFDSKTAIFIPAEDMAYETAYTVTLSGELPGLSGDTLAEDYSFRFKTESRPDRDYANYLYPYDSPAETFAIADPIVIKLYANSAFADQAVTVALYRYPDLDAYLAAYKSNLLEDAEFLPVDGLEEVTSYEDRLLMDNDMYWNTAFLPLHENPGPGWYLADIRTSPGSGGTNNKQVQKLLQVTDIAVYTQTSGGRTLFWLNDAGSGEPIAGADIAVEGQRTRSDRDGLAVLDVPAEQSDRYSWLYADKELRIALDGRRFGEYLPFYGESGLSLQKQYYTFIYTDREAYQPDDTVHFWGMVLPRASGAAKPANVTLNWTEGGKYPDGLTFTVQADGTFQGELLLEKHVSGWEYIEVRLDEETLTGMYFSVLQYVKPVYTAEITPDKAYYRKGDTVGIVASANFFDGTPAEGLDLSLSYYDRVSSKSASVRTDENGRARASFMPDSETSWRPRYGSIYGNTVSAEDQPIYFNRSVLVFPADYMLRSATRLTDGGFILDLEGYAIDFSQVDSGAYAGAGSDDEVLRGGSAEMHGEARLYQVEYVKKKTGEYYDFINKVVVDRYSYDREERFMELITIQTENGRFSSQPFIYPKVDNIYYYFAIDCVCPDGATLTETRYVQGYQAYYNAWPDNPYKRYYFRQDRQDSASYSDDYYYYGYVSSGSYSLDETIPLRLTDQDDRIPEQGRLLCAVLGKELFSWGIEYEREFTLSFLPEYVPNAVIVGAYFDGNHIFSVSHSAVSYRMDDSNLDISVTPDKDRYRPGEEAVLNLRVTDGQGQGKAANYLLSAADEAAFAVMDQNVDPLSEIYRSFYIDYRQYASYIQPYEVDYGAECGEGDADSVRRDFVDTAAFLSGQTDGGGRATLRFTLPDNITSWRLTSLAFYESSADGVNMPLVGKDVSHIESGLPFFINQVLSEKYLAGDSVGLSLRCAGSAIRGDSAVEYSISLRHSDVGEGGASSPGSGGSGGGGNAGSGSVLAEKSASATAGDYCLVDLGAPSAGIYKVLIQARCGEYSDAIEKEIEVVDSLLLTSRQQSGDLSEGISVSARRFPVGLVLYDMDNKLYYDILYRMLYAGGQRADQVVSRALAGRRLNVIEPGSDYPEEPDLDGEEAYAWRDGLRLFPYAQTDPLLTARVAAIAPELINRSTLTDYFMRILHSEDSTGADIAAAYMGLGALKAPILPDLRLLFAEARESEVFTPEQTIYLATGLALLGDNEPVYAWYTDTLQPRLTKEGNTLCYRKTGRAHEDYKLTAAIAALTSIINHPDHRQLLLYLTSNSSATYLPLLELATYVSRYLPKPDSVATFSYRLGDRTIRQDFDKHRQLYLEFGETQLAQADFQVIEGHIGYSLYYYGGFDEAEKALPEGVGLSQSQSADIAKLGDTVTVSATISFNTFAPVGYYHISLAVPVGLRFTRVPDYSYYDNWYYRVGEGGMLDFYIFPIQGYQSNSDFNQTSMPESITFSYEARAVLPGTYILEAPAISYSGSNTLYAGERRQIRVEK